MKLYSYKNLNMSVHDFLFCQYSMITAQLHVLQTQKVEKLLIKDKSLQ